MLGVARSSFYAWRHRVETPAAARRRELAEHVGRVFADSRRTYGCRRVAAALNREGIACSVGLVADLMRELGLVTVQPRAYKTTTVPGELPVTSPDLLERDFTAATPASAAGRWSVPAFVDAGLGRDLADFSVSYFVFSGCQVSECGVSSLGVVVGFDPVECRLFEVCDGGPRSGVDEFFLVGREE